MDKCLGRVGVTLNGARSLATFGMKWACRRDKYVDADYAGERGFKSGVILNAAMDLNLSMQRDPSLRPG
jgi:hypothetical protein